MIIVILDNEKLESISSRTNKPISLNQLKENRSKSLEDTNSGKNRNHEDPNKDFTELNSKLFAKVSEPILENQSTPDQLSEIQKESILKDAFFAQFDNPSIEDLELPIGPDNREIVNDTSQFPHSSICRLYITSAHGTTLYGTGIYIGPNCILTAAHCVYIHERGGWASKIEVVPGLNREHRPFGQTTSNDFYCPNLYIEKPTKELRQPYDFAAIITPRAYGDELGYIGFSSLTDQEFNNLLITICGYSGDIPKDAPGKAQSKHTSEIVGKTATIIKYETDTFEGASGSPVLYEKNNKIYACGIHNFGNKNFNSGTRITDGIHNKIREWKYLQS